MVTRLFFDCEFTDLRNSASLISAGFITQSGDPFYVELSDYQEEACNDFVKATVLPLLSLPPVSTADFIASLTAWLLPLGKDLLFISDSEWDRRILAKSFALQSFALPSNWAFQKAPDNFSSGLQRTMFNDEMEAFFLRNPDQKQHHALTDARAIRQAYLRAESVL